MLGIDSVEYDPTDSGTIGDSDTVGSHTLAGDGTPITTTTVASDEGLDVFLINASIVVTATDLDIRDLTHVSDSVEIGDGTDTMGVNADGSINVVATATDLDIRDLTHVSDSVRLGDGSSLLTSTLVGSDQALDVFNVNDPGTANSSILSTQKDVTTVSGVILAAELAARKRMWFQNVGTRAVFAGAPAVTTANGIRMRPGSILEIAIGASISLHAVAAAGTQDTRVLEAA